MKHINVALFVPHLGCPHACVFCDQHAISGQRAPITREAIVSACETAAKTPHDVANSEIAFFGGSFTAVDRATQAMCLRAAAPYLKTAFGGIRVSTRPDAIDEETLSFLKENGVTAIELGAQSMDEEALQKNERGHTPADTVKAGKLIRSFGFSLGLQMMTGLYGSTDETDLATAEALIALRPDTVRIYPTVVLKNTRLASLYAEGLYKPPTLDESVSLCAKLLTRFHEAKIPVIRLGLHAGGDVENSYVAGPYHPAFRELCENRIYKAALLELLSPLPPGRYTVLVPPGHASKAAGQKRANLVYFAGQKYLLKIVTSPDVPAFQPLIAQIND